MPQALRRRSVTVMLCTLLLTPAIVAAVGSGPLGTLRCDGVVFVGSARVGGEAAVYSGDQVTTTDGRAILSLARANRVVIERGSTASLWRSPDGLRVGLEKGRLALTADGKAPLRLEADGLTLSPSGSFPSLAQLAMMPDGSMGVSVHRGAITIQNLRAEPVVVAAGKFITISPRLAQKQPPKSQPIGTGAHGKMTLGEKLRTFRIGNLSHGVSVAILGGTIAGATAAAIIVPLTVGEEKASPSVP